MTSLKNFGYDVTGVYFFDHSCGSGDETIEGLQFGETFYKTASWFEEQGMSLWWNRILPKSCTVNFRQCYVGNEKNRTLLKNLAKWTNRTVTGATDITTYMNPEIDDSYDPDWEHDGPDYTYGSLWGAKPSGDPWEIWPKYRQTTWRERLGGWGPTVANENQPY